MSRRATSPGIIPAIVSPALLASVALVALTAGSGCSGGSSELPLVINELRADPIEFVEILNVGSTTVSLEGVSLTDSDEEGMPIEADTAPMPVIGLAPGDRFVVILGQEESDGELRTGTIDCRIVGIPDCVHARFRLRSATGETLYLRDGGAIIDSVDLPADATEPEQSYCRIPDGTGSLQACTASPAELNAAE